MDTADDLVADGAMTVTEAVKLSGIGKSTLYAVMEKGELCYLKIGKARRIPRRALTRWLADHLVARDTGPKGG